jgi:signal peptidase II
MERSDPGGVRPSRLLALIGTIVAVDAVTKFLAVYRLALTHVPNEVLGDVLRLTLVYNPGAAFGLHLGSWSRPLFIGLTFVALGLLWSLYRQSAPTARARVWAVATITAGALGTLVDRVRSSRGVVDFVDVGVGAWRWPTFNVADSAVSVGALALIVILWREESALRKK